MTTPSTPGDGLASRGFREGSAGSTIESVALRATPDEEGLLAVEGGQRARLKAGRGSNERSQVFQGYDQIFEFST